VIRVANINLNGGEHRHIACEGNSVRLKLTITKNGAVLCDGTYDISDASSFGEACADSWTRLREQRLEKATSIGALYETLDENVLGILRGARIMVEDASL
jgi:hypothetical protein